MNMTLFDVRIWSPKTFKREKDFVVMTIKSLIHKISTSNVGT
jgi:hypothetical protein